MRRTFIALTLGLGLIASAGHAQTADAKATVAPPRLPALSVNRGTGSLAW